MFDKIIIGAGLYGLYAALFCAKKGEKVLVLEYDNDSFARATYINQARVHMGYHYPRSISTAVKSAHYFERFCEDFPFSILDTFKQVYATSSNFSWTTAKQFKKFCDAAKIKCESLDVNKYFKHDLCDGAFLTQEYTYDALLLRDYFMAELQKFPHIEMKFAARINTIVEHDTHYVIKMADGAEYKSDFVLNATYASTNQIIKKIQTEHKSQYNPFKIKYELCEIILCKTENSALRDIGITVMDGPFFSIMPFGKTGYHSLTAVTFTPHDTSYEELPRFICQKNNSAFCTPEQLGNCNICPHKPQTAFPYMANLARKYLREEYTFQYEKSLYSMKPILQASEIDDSRPTLIHE